MYHSPKKIQCKRSVHTVYITMYSTIYIVNNSTVYSTVHCTVVYCTVVYCTLVYCTVQYSVLNDTLCWSLTHYPGTPSSHIVTDVSLTLQYSITLLTWTILYHYSTHFLHTARFSLGILPDVRSSLTLRRSASLVW